MNRRRLLQLGATLFAAPSIVRAESLMRVCVVPVAECNMTRMQKMVAEFLTRDAELFRNAWASSVASPVGWKSLDQFEWEDGELPKSDRPRYKFPQIHAAKEILARNGIGFTKHENGIITLKRPNYSEIRFWSEND